MGALHRTADYLEALDVQPRDPRLILTARLPRPVFRALAAAADESHTSRSQLVLRALEADAAVARHLAER